jgi:hypothetical protein
VEKKEKIIDVKPKVSKLHTLSREGGATEMITTMSRKVVFGRRNQLYALHEHSKATYVLSYAMHALLANLVFK